MKKYLLVAIVLLISGCSVLGDEVEIPISSVQGAVDLNRTFDELYNTSEEIVQIRVLSHDEVVVLDDVPFTISNVEIRDVFKGHLNIKDVIQVSEVGGVYYPLLFGDPSLGKSTEPVEIALDGVRVMQPGEDYIIFINSHPNPSYDSYYIRSEYQGKYQLSNDKLVNAREESLYRFTFDTVDEMRDKIKSLE